MSRRSFCSAWAGGRLNPKTASSDTSSVGVAIVRCEGFNTARSLCWCDGWCLRSLLVDVADLRCLREKDRTFLEGRVAFSLNVRDHIVCRGLDISIAKKDATFGRHV